MFATAKIGRKLSKQAFSAEVTQLRTDLLEAQIAAREQNIPVYLIIAGIEGAGKGDVVNKLDEWLDARGVNVYAFWEESDEEWLVFEEPVVQVSEERNDPVPEGEESTEKDDES